MLPTFLKFWCFLFLVITYWFIKVAFAADSLSPAFPEKSGLVGPVKIQTNRPNSASSEVNSVNQGPIGPQSTPSPQVSTSADDTVEPEFPKEFRDFWKQECHRYYMTIDEYSSYKSCYDNILQKAREFQETHYNLEEFDTEEQNEVFVHNLALNRVEEKERLKNKKVSFGKTEINNSYNKQDSLRKRIEAELDEISVEANLNPEVPKSAEPGKTLTSKKSDSKKSNRENDSSSDRINLENKMNNSEIPIIELEEIDLNQKSKLPHITSSPEKSVSKKH